MRRRNPTREELLSAVDRTVPDVIAPDLQVLFCGINPGLYTAVVGHHFARPGNRFWPALHRAGFTERQLSPAEEHSLLERGYGITNVVPRATATAAELAAAEYIEGGVRLREKLEQYRPRWLAVLGVEAYRKAFGEPRAIVGPQLERLGGTSVWVLPNPSGLNAHYQLPQLALAYGELRQALESVDGGGGR